MDWEAWRAQFPTLARVNYLNTCSLGLLARPVRAAMDRHLDLWQERGASAWYGPWLDEVQRLREGFARTIHARPEEVAVMPNVSTTLAVLASGMGTGRRRVVTTALDFPTIAYQWLNRPDVDVATVATGDGVTIPLDGWTEAVDDTTLAVATSHVMYTTGFRQDVKAVSRLARDTGAWSIIDAYQGVGQVPVDVRDIGCDVLISGGLKWLLGGTGVAYVYVRRERLDDLSPTIAGWFGNAHQFDFDPARFTPRPDARRLELGTPSVGSVYTAAAGLDVIHDAGLARVIHRTQDLARDLVERLGDAGFPLAVPTGERDRSAIVPVLVDDAPAVVARLADADIVVDARPGRVRLSPYAYNTEQDVEDAVSALVKAAG